MGFPGMQQPGALPGENPFNVTVHRLAKEADLYNLFNSIRR